MSAQVPVGWIDPDGHLFPLSSYNPAHPNQWDGHKKAWRRVAIMDEQPMAVTLASEPVHGDLLPPMGSTVDIHLGSMDAWVPHTVVGYYAWGDLKGNPALHRVFVRVTDAQGYENARLLKDVRQTAAGPAIAELEEVEEAKDPEAMPMCLLCRGSGEGQFDGGTCRGCGGSGVER